MSKTTAWTNLSDALPPDSENAVIVLMEDRSMRAVARLPQGWGATLADWKDAKAVAWQPIQWPEVPREESQGEKDVSACDAWYNENWARKCGAYSGAMYPPPPFDVQTVWRAALQWERKQVLVELSSLYPAQYDNLPGIKHCINRLRRRCGLDK